jgi:hypothetical protein
MSFNPGEKPVGYLLARFGGPQSPYGLYNKGKFFALYENGIPIL